MKTTQSSGTRLDHQAVAGTFEFKSNGKAIAISFTDQQLSPHAGSALFWGWLRPLDWCKQLAAALPHALPLGSFAYLIVDARYEKVRIDGVVRSCAVLIALGLDDAGQRSVLGVSARLSEAEVHWREFLASLQARGLHGLRFIVSDDHAGLRAALTARFAGVPWQRCQFHLQQNAMAFVPKIHLRAEVAATLRTVFNAADLPEAQRRLKTVVEKYQESVPNLAG